MIRTIKRAIFGSLSILGISCLIWTVLLLNPGTMYSESTTIDNVTVHHNQELPNGAEVVIKNAMTRIKASSIYDEHFKMDLCLNDGSSYPKLHPIPGGTAYAFLNKAVLFDCKPNFAENVADFKWALNNYEARSYDLTYLIAHELTHNLQYNFDKKYSVTTTFGKINWKLEGHADYIAREFKNDGLLKDKIDLYLREEMKKHVGIPVIKLEDGTIQNLAYFKYALVVQYLLEEEKLSFGKICKQEKSLEELYDSMIDWRNS